uniref:Cytochrome P450 n=1 Tax=Strigamia maritima TaxID=126957 RepID=T1JHA1_STRMM
MATAIRSFKEIPGPRNWPVFGSLLLYKTEYYSIDKYRETLSKMRAEYGDIVKEHLGSRVVIHLFDPEEVRKIYATEGKKPEVIPLQETVKKYRKMRKFHEGLGNINGDEWYRLRKGIQQFVMKPKITGSYLTSVDETVNELIGEIKKRKNENHYVTDLNVLMSKWNFESSSKIFLESAHGSFDGGQNEVTIEKLIDLNLTVFNLSAQLKYSLPLYKIFSTPKWKKLVKSEDVFMETISIPIKDAIKRIKNMHTEGKLRPGYSFLRHLLSLPELDQEDVFILCFSMMADGLTTTSPAAVTNLYSLSRNPEAQEKLYQEIIGLVGPNEPITEEQLEKMNYLRACIKENFRVFPTGTEVSRIIRQDLVLNNYHVPSGTAVDLNHMEEFMNEKTFPNPKEYRPERWINEIKSINPFLMTQFSHGIRTCPGRRFAEQDLYVLLCRVLQNFRLEYNPNDSPMEQVYGTLMFPDRVPRIAFKPRKI